MRSALLVVLSGLFLSGCARAEDEHPVLSARVPFLSERLHSGRWQVRYALLGELEGRDSETKAALETLCEDAHQQVAQQALVRYEGRFVDVRKPLFEPARFLPRSYPVTSLAPGNRRRMLVEYCLGRREIRLSSRDHAGLRILHVLEPARLDDAEMGLPLTVVGLMGEAEDATGVRPFLASPNDYVLLCAAKAMVRLGHPEEGVAALCVLARREPKVHLYYVTQALHALRELGFPGLKELVQDVVRAVDRTESIQRNWLSGFLLLAAEVTTPEILLRESTASPSGASSEDPTLEFLRGLRPDSVIEEPARVGHGYAEADIERGVTRILLYGEPWNSAIDEETGYPLVRVAGCFITEDFLRLVEAYNAAMREHARAQRAGD